MAVLEGESKLACPGDALCDCPAKRALAWIGTVQKNRRIYSGLGVLLLLAGLCLVIVQRPGRQDASAPSGQAAAKDTDAGPREAAASSRSADRKRDSAQKYWAVAKELAAETNAAGATASPILVSYLKSDPERTTLRVGFRQEKQGVDDVEPEDYTLEVVLLDASGNNLGEENTDSSVWWTDEENAASKGLPMLEVKSLSPVSGVQLKLSYKGQEVEQRKYEVAER